MVFLSQKVDGNMIFTDYWKVLVLTFSEMGNTVLSQKVDGNMIFTEYWKVLVLNFLVMRNTVFFWVKKLMERLYLLVTENFLFWTFWWWEIRSFFSQNVDGKMIFTWSFWAFYDIPGPGKYGFSRSVFLFEIICENLFFYENFFCLWESLLIERTFWKFYHLCQSMSFWK